MRTGHLLFSAVHYLFILFILSIGLFSLGLAHAPLLRSSLYEFILKDPHFFTIFGYGAIGLGVVLIAGFYAMQRKIFYQVKMNPHAALIDSSLVESYVQACWKEFLPDLPIQSEVVVHPNQKIEIFAKFPTGSIGFHQEMLQKVEKQLGELLAKHLGYTEEFLLTVIVE